MPITGPTQSNITSGTTAGTISLNFLSPCFAGDFVAVAVATNTGSGTTVSVVDALSNTYSQAGGYIPQTNLVVSLWYSILVNGGTNAIVVTPSAGGHAALALAEYTGVLGPTSGALDQASIGDAGTQAACDTNLVGVTATGELVIGVFGQVTSGLPYTAVTGSVVQDFDCTATKIGLCMVDLLNVSASVTPAGTYGSPSALWAGIGASFFPAVPPPPPSGRVPWYYPTTPQHQTVISM